MTQPVAIVTGASRGIGAFVADALQGAGYAVERGSRSTAPVTDRAAVEGWVADVVARHGRIDLLVNNAGVIDSEVPLQESDPDEWWATVEVNVLGPYLLTRTVLPHMLSAGNGRVINLNSGAGVRPGAVASAYNVSKTALARITGSTHLAGKGRGVFAFDLAPGVVRTDMTQSMLAHRGRTEWTDPGDVTALVLALASGDLDAWSGRMVRAGSDSAESLMARQQGAGGVGEHDRTIGLVPWGADDPLA
ncbi:3-oxoacyl-ACP reductase [Knoellia sinensis KCTC 19936]|uniref:3-oxoacyl-ACP reductase n=1 Tax=Knoellia sinensis KCTC 19936 TaxID=1385520 RepID=A0A0A0JCQ3_9MICO|nr:SDR family NAD(P)-dependent oxidoreductase [Knoellia sinensis]KGN34539.1 3-oxoacyl-ACP reductase [Knoellia sinensis KCTC 19936]